MCATLGSPRRPRPIDDLTGLIDDTDVLMVDKMIALAKKILRRALRSMRRAAIYCRISDDREGAGLGVARQDVDCREQADRLGWGGRWLVGGQRPAGLLRQAAT